MTILGAVWALAALGTASAWWGLRAIFRQDQENGKAGLFPRTQRELMLTLEQDKTLKRLGLAGFTLVVVLFPVLIVLASLCEK